MIRPGQKTLRGREIRIRKEKLLLHIALIAEKCCAKALLGLANGNILEGSKLFFELWCLLWPKSINDQGSGQ